MEEPPFDWDRFYRWMDQFYRAVGVAMVACYGLGVFSALVSPWIAGAVGVFVVAVAVTGTLRKSG